MSHLPECWLSEGKFDALCLCDRLRACEQRVLDAAREAVAGIQDGPKNQPYWIDREAALTAIDALREKP